MVRNVRFVKTKLLKRKLGAIGINIVLNIFAKFGYSSLFKTLLHAVGFGAKY